VKRFAAAVQSLAQRHPGAFQLFQRGPARGDKAMQSLESAIAAFRSDGFTRRATHCAIRTVNVAILGLVLDEMGSHMKPAVKAELSNLSTDQFPQIHEILNVGEKVDSVQFLLEALIDGISANRNYDYHKS
jgi:hypothetical protein